MGLLLKNEQYPSMVNSLRIERVEPLVMIDGMLNMDKNVRVGFLSNLRKRVSLKFRRKSRDGGTYGQKCPKELL